MMFGFGVVGEKRRASNYPHLASIQSMCGCVKNVKLRIIHI